MGKHRAHHNHVRAVWKRKTEGDPEHGLTKNDARRDDRQNFMTTCRCTGTKAIAALKRMQTSVVDAVRVPSSLRNVPCPLSIPTPYPVGPLSCPPPFLMPLPTDARNCGRV